MTTKPLSVDFPAAHSMDTAWFAIDNDGNVALFESGEAGAVPEEAYIGDDAWTLQEELRALPVTGFKFDSEGYGQTQWMQHLTLDANLGADTEAFVFLSDLVPAADLLSRLDASDMDATAGKAVRIVCRDLDALAELHAREACLGCFRDWGDRMAEEIARHGIYRYDHTCENWISGPYARVTVPTKPLTIREIPASIRDKAIAFDGRFADSLRIQPAEHWSCSSWEHGWLSSDGKTARPFADYVEEWGEDADAHEEGGGGGGGGGGDNPIQFVHEPLEPTGAPKKRWWK